MEEKHYFTSFDEGEDSLFERELFSNNSISTENDNEINLENYYSLIDDLATENIFLKGVYKFLNKLEGEWDQDNEQSIINFIKKKYRTKGIPWEKTQIQWLKGIKEPSTKQSNKENSYNFCYALDMDLKTTAEFMFKYFQVIPFNVKNRVDAIYFYCIKNKKKYFEIVEMLEKAKRFPEKNNEYETIQIERQIEEIDNDVEFMKYLELNCYSREYQSQAARKIANNLVDKCKKKIGVKANTKLLLEISGYNNQDTTRVDICDDNGNKYMGIKDSKLPKKFTSSFPNDMALSKLKNGKSMSDESLRKIIILLEFYYYYSEIQENMKKNNIVVTDDIVKEVKNDFLIQLNTLLSECGYCQLYSRNVYDAHFLCFSNSKNPNKLLKSLIRQVYFEELSSD